MTGSEINKQKHCFAIVAAYTAAYTPRSPLAGARKALSAATLAVTFLAIGMTTGCSRQVVSTTTNLPGAQAAPQIASTDPSTPGSVSGRAAIDAFLKAVNAQDLQAMSTQWGNAKGLARDQFKRDELEKRLIVMQCLMQHDSYRYPEDRARLVTGGRQEYLVELKRGNIVSQTTFTTITGPQGRWYVEDVDVTKLRDFCR